MRHKFILSIFSLLVVVITNAQNVGIGTTAPKASFNVAANKTVLFGSDTTSAENKLMWLPVKGAFRAGYYPGSTNDTIGLYSTAMGYYCIAKGNYSTAIGAGTTASQYSSTAMGVGTTASGNGSTAMGSGTTASGYNSTAMGSGTTASGFISTAMGYNCSTNSHTNSFCISGGSSTTNPQVANSADYQMMMYFDTYTFWSGTSGQGVDLPSNGNSWVSHCDKRKKENFVPLNGEDVLKKISNIKFTSWNYKHCDAKNDRHYGVMAQDFHSAFGHDSYGNIGNDTTVNPIDMIGIDMSAIKALEKRTEKIEKLQKQNTAQQQQINTQQQQIAQLQQSNLTQQQNNLALQQQMQTLLNNVASLNKQVQALATKTNNQNTVAANK
jgi:hypothetical protein